MKKIFSFVLALVFMIPSKHTKLSILFDNNYTKKKPRSLKSGVLWLNSPPTDHQDILPLI